MGIGGGFGGGALEATTEIEAAAGTGDAIFGLMEGVVAAAETAAGDGAAAACATETDGTVEIFDSFGVEAAVEDAQIEDAFAMAANFSRLMMGFGDGTLLDVASDPPMTEMALEIDDDEDDVEDFFKPVAHNF